MCVFSHDCDPMGCIPPGSSVHGIFQQEYQSGLPFPSLEDLPNPGIEPASPALAGGCLTTMPPISKRLLTLWSSFAPVQRQDNPIYTFGPPEGSAGSLPRSKRVFICKGKKEWGGAGAAGMGTKVHFRKSFIANSILCIDFERKHPEQNTNDSKIHI